MPRKGENIYKRHDGRWEGRILKPDGKYKYVYAPTYKEVKEKKRKFQINQEDKNNQYGTITNISSLFESWLKNDAIKHVRISTYMDYHRCIFKYVIPFFSNENENHPTVFAVAAFANSIINNTVLSEPYKRKILSIFKAALKSIMKDSSEYLSLTKAIKLPTVQNDEVQVFSIMEQRLIEKAALQFHDRRALGILLCFYTGIRLGELCALKWDNLDFEAGTISIVKTVSRIKNFEQGNKKTFLLIGNPKSNKSMRKIPLPDFLLKLFNDYRIHDTDNNFVLSGSEIPIDPRSCQKLFKKVLTHASVRYRKFHAIRHTFATRALELGIDIKTLSEILGHSSVTITLNIYAHSLMEQKRIAMDKLNEMHHHFMMNTYSPS